MKMSLRLCILILGTACFFAGIGVAKVKTGSGLAGLLTSPDNDSDATAESSTGPSSAVTVSGKKCTPDKYMPLELLMNMLGEGSGITTKTEGGILKITVGSRIKNCLDLKLPMSQEGDGPIIVYAVNNSSEVASSEGKDFNEKFENCLKRAGVLDGEGNLDKSKASMADPETFILDFSHLKKKVPVVFGSPTALREGSNGYAAVIGNNNKVNAGDCFMAEELRAGGLSLLGLYDREKLIYEKVYKDYPGVCNETGECENPNLEVEALTKILEKVTDDTLKSELKKKLASAQARDDEGLSKNFSEQVSSIKSADLTNYDMADFENALDKVVEVVDKKIETLKKLYADYQKTTDKKKKAELKKEIADLANSIKKFSTSYGLDAAVRNLEKYGMFDLAEKVEEFLLKSKYVGQAAANKPPAALEKDVSMRMGLYRAGLDKKKIEFAARNGLATPSRAYSRAAQQLKERIYEERSGIQRAGQKAYRRACAPSMMGGLANPTKCQRFLRKEQGRQAAIKKYFKGLSKRAKSNLEIARHYESLEAEGYQKQRIQERALMNEMGISGVDTYFGSDYTRFSDSYDDYDDDDYYSGFGGNQNFGQQQGTGGRSPAIYSNSNYRGGGNQVTGSSRMTLQNPNAQMNNINGYNTNSSYNPFTQGTNPYSANQAISSLGQYLQPNYFSGSNPYGTGSR
jgi:hypothetical protein